jgi:hypothetical protein
MPCRCVLLLRLRETDEVAGTETGSSGAARLPQLAENGTAQRRQSKGIP